MRSFSPSALLTFSRHLHRTVPASRCRRMRHRGTFGVPDPAARSCDLRDRGTVQVCSLGRASLRLSAFILLLVSCAPIPTPVTPPPPSGSVLFEDEFDLNSTGWDRFANEGGIMDYYEGGYRILVQRPGLNFWSTPEKDYRDVRIEVDVLKLAGPDENRMGLMCRYQNGNHYFFIISNDGYYAIGKFIDGQTTLLGQSEMSPNAMIQPNMINHLRADCVGDTLKFYVNFTEIAATQDGDLKSGDVGVLAGTFSQAGVDVSFDHFVAIQP